ncbi:glycosyltransferase [Pedobacter sp.]|uniref:glycosyltransferase n=1 Tax=Pedobacter sp. TaxID=1411316 RepID=UPI002C5C7999|nr:glycosyltransferase [Pedobacter sp.]HWW41765.1 glycosyltransferase [Pedobacter sp.]
MNKLPLVSILTALYNHEGYVKESLDSILQEEYSNLELIIVNDGSTDNSEEVVKKWIEENSHLIKVIYICRPNKGICATANELINRANGKYIVWLPSDDILINNTIKDRVSILENSPDKLVLLSDAAVINSKGEKVGDSSMEHHQVNKDNYHTVDGIIKQTIQGLGISGATLFVNKEIYNLVGLYPENLAAEDWYFFQRAASKEKILFWDKTVSLYRIHDKNTSHALNYKIFSSIIASFVKNYFQFPNWYYRYLATVQIVKLSLIYMKVRAKVLIHELS